MDAKDRYLKIMLMVLITLMSIYLFGQLRGFLLDVWAVIKALLLPFLSAMIVTYVLSPVVDMLVRRRVPRGISILIIYLAFVVLIAVAVLNAIPVVSRQIASLTEHLPSLINQLNTWIDQVSRQKQYLPDPMRKGLESALNQAQQNVVVYAGNILAVLTSTFSAVMAAFVVPFLVFYMLKDAKTIGNGLVRLAPRRHRNQFREILTGIDGTLGRYVRGQLLVMLAVGILTYAGLLIVRMPYALLLALFVSLTNVIPYLGPFIGSAPALLLALSMSPQMALKVLIVNVVVQQCEGNLISPQIMGKTLDLHPMSIVAALLLGGEIGGILGLIAAVPVLAVGKVVWLHVRNPKASP